MPRINCCTNSERSARSCWGLPDATTRPSDNRKLLSATVAVCFTSWETTILVMPRASFNLPN